ncbi:MAG: DUF1844 domain-containing protein [Blastocatellia bacterium]|jgi:hypothetical protein
MPEENQSGFKISDRRLFNADGSLREDAVIEEVSISQFESLVEVPAAPATEESATVSAAEPYPTAEPYPEDEPEGAPEQTLFTEFLMQIASSAFIYLGLVEHPATGRRQVNLEAAKESIEMLDMLREKTQGNLTRGEEKLFEDLMADLKMQFVARRR